MTLRDRWSELAQITFTSSAAFGAAASTSFFYVLICGALSIWIGIARLTRDY